MQKQQEYLVEQQKMEERQRMEKDIMEKGRLNQIKNKGKEEESKYPTHWMNIEKHTPPIKCL